MYSIGFNNCQLVFDLL